MILWIIMKLIKLYLFISGIFVVCFAQSQQKLSPCPNIFTYETDRDSHDTWHGTLKLQTSVVLHGITVDVILDRKAATFGAYYFKDVSTTDYMEYRVEDKNYRLDPGKTLFMNVYVRYENYIPHLKQVRLNGQNICDLPTPAVQPIYPSNNHNQQSITTTTRRLNQQGDLPSNHNYNFNNYDTTTQRNSFDNSWNNNRHQTTTTTTLRSTTNDRRRDVYGNSNSNSNYNNNNSRDVYSGSSNRPINNNQGHEIYNQDRNPIQTPKNYSTGVNQNDYDSYNNNNRRTTTTTTGRYNERDFDNFNNNNNNNRRTTSITTQRNYERDFDNFNNNNNNNRRTSSTTTDRSYERDFNNFNNNDRRQTTQYPYEYEENVNNNRRTTSSRRLTSTTQDKFYFDQTTTRGYFQGDLPFGFGHDTTTHSILNLDENVQCGNIVPKANPLIVHGEETYQGQFPWHAALYLSEIGSLKYICGGSLVSMSSIVTAAHCVTHTKSRRAISSEKVLVYLGKQNLQKWTGSEQDAKVAEIIINSDYNSETFFGDIAILKLKDTLKRTNYVRPVCVWSFDNDLRNIVNKQGLVPGWGYNENGVVSENLSHVKMPVVTHETCIWSNREFFSKVTSDKSFCAGFRNGTTLCGGDSGGGMVFKQGGYYYLRGIVSVSVALQNSRRCDPNHYVVFADAAKYSDWINDNM